MANLRESADYPHIIHPDEPWKEIHLYTFGGTSVQEIDWSPERKIPKKMTVSLVGQFKYDPITYLLIGSSSLGGFSTVEGKMTPKRLLLNITECDPNAPDVEDEEHEFHFKRIGDLWVGAEHVIGDNFPYPTEKIPATLTTTLIHTNAFGINLGEFARHKHWANCWMEPRIIGEDPLATDQ